MVSGIRFVVEDRSQVPSFQTNAKACFTIRSRKGPIPSEGIPEIRSYSRLLEVFGTPYQAYDDHLRLKHALDRGVPCYISRIVHYGNISNAATVAALAVEVTVQDRT